MRDEPQTNVVRDIPVTDIDARLRTPPSHEDPVPPSVQSADADATATNGHGEDAVQLVSRSQDVNPRDSLLVTPSATPPGGLYSVVRDIQDAFEEVRKRISTLTRETMLGIMSLYGCGSMTVKQYDFVCNIVAIANSKFVLPSSSSLRRVKWPYFINKLFPKSTIAQLQRKKPKTKKSDKETTPAAQEPRIEQGRVPSRPATEGQHQGSGSQPQGSASQPQGINGDSGADDNQRQGLNQDQRQGSTSQAQGSNRDGEAGNQRQDNRRQGRNDDGGSGRQPPQGNGDDGAEAANHSNSTKTSPVVILPVSEWAKYDFANIILRNDMADVSSERTIEDTPICSNAAKVSVEQDQLLISNGSTVFPARRGDMVQFQSTLTDSASFPIHFKVDNEGDDGINAEGLVSFMFTSGVFGQDHEDNSSAYADFVSDPEESLSLHERFLLRYIKVCSANRDKVTEPSDDRNEPQFALKSGDVCTVLLPPTHRNTQEISTFGVLISRFWRTTTDRRSQLMFFFDCDLSDPSEATITCRFESVVKGIPTLRVTDSESADREDTLPPPPPVSGTLSDGRLFYVYRILLYCDDFVPRSSLFPKGSVGGVYFIR